MSKKRLNSICKSDIQALTKYYFIIQFLTLLSFQLNAQHLKANHNRIAIGKQNAAKLSSLKITDCSGLFVPNFGKTPFLTNIKNLEKKHKYGSEIEILKAKKTKLNNPLTQQANENNLSNSSQNLILGTNFQGNIFNGGAPPDNTIAIANNGNIVSVINCNVAYFNNNGNQLWTGSFWELFNDPTLTELIYDPIVLYDSQADRFVMIAIHGFTSATSKLIVSFSKTNNPIDGWWIYKLSGNPLNNSCWLDYPKLGISNNEIFITGNLFADNTGFSESVIYQIGKNNGYGGANLNWSIWSNISGSPITIIPASYGQQGNYGPGLYFVNQSPGSGNAVELYEITDSLNGNPQLTRNTIFKSDYEPSGNALQSGTSVELITGDCRILNAFYLDGIIHYVFQSDYQNSNYTGINYNRLNVSTLTNLSYSFGQIGFDCAYPTVASYASSATDKTVIFCYLRSGVSIFPETRAIVFDNNQTWSNSILVKSGVNYVDAFQYDNTVRWGDYKGIAFKYNPINPEVWVSGCYGSSQNLFNTNYNCFNNWIAQITDITLNTTENNISSKIDLKLFPNPIIELFNIEFEVKFFGYVKIDIVDMTGKIVETLFSGNLKAGKNSLTFNRNVLLGGTYILTIKTADNTFITKKLIIEK
jgi:hypothetical protein